MKRFRSWWAALVHIGIVLSAGLIISQRVGSNEAITLCAGGLVSLLTLVGVIWTTERLIQKKPIALTASSIVIKYALLGWILYELTMVHHMDILWLGLGVTLILPSLFIFGLLSEKGLSEPEEEEN